MDGRKRFQIHQRHRNYVIKGLRVSNIAPPGGWRYEDPDTGFKYSQRYRGMGELLRHVKTYRAQNKLQPIPHLRDVVEHWLCQQPNMERYCRSKHMKRTARQYYSGAKAYVSALVDEDDSHLATREEAEARAAICANCPHNEAPEEKSKLAELADVKIQGLVGERTTSLDRELFMCSICSCPLRAKVHFAQDFVEDFMEDRTRYLVPSGLPGKDGQPLYCWQVHPVRVNDGKKN